MGFKVNEDGFIVTPNGFGVGDNCCCPPPAEPICANCTDPPDNLLVTFSGVDLLGTDSCCDLSSFGYASWSVAPASSEINKSFVLPLDTDWLTIWDCGWYAEFPVDWELKRYTSSSICAGFATPVTGVLAVYVALHYNGGGSYSYRVTLDWWPTTGGARFFVGDQLGVSCGAEGLVSNDYVTDDLCDYLAIRRTKAGANGNATIIAL